MPSIHPSWCPKNFPNDSWAFKQVNHPYRAQTTPKVGTKKRFLPFFEPLMRAYLSVEQFWRPFPDIFTSNPLAYWSQIIFATCPCKNHTCRAISLGYRPSGVNRGKKGPLEPKTPDFWTLGSKITVMTSKLTNIRVHSVIRAPRTMSQTNIRYYLEKSWGAPLPPNIW